MNNSFFSHIPCGQTLPQNNIHAVSVSMPKLQDVIDYEDQTPEILEKIKSAYPRFVLHPYLRVLAKYIEEKYNVSQNYEVVLLSSQKAVEIVSNKYYIHNKIEIDEPFGVILVQKNSRQLQNVLKYIQHVGYNLSSRLAQDYLFTLEKIEKKHKEQYENKDTAYNTIIETLSDAYIQPKENICLTPSGMNAVYCALRGIKNIQARNGRTVLVQLGWLYLDTMNIVEHYFEENKKFYDVSNLDALEEYLKEDGLKVSAIITEVPTNPLLKCPNLPRLKKLCDKYNIPLVIDSTFATPYLLDLKPYADIYIESLTKFACGNADVLMGAIILNSNSKISHISAEFFKYTDMPYIKDLQRMAYEIKDYKTRMRKVSSNTKKLVEYFKSSPIIDKIFYCLSDENKTNYKNLMIDEDSWVGIVSVTFKKEFEKIYDNLNIAKGPSLGTEFTLLMPYTYLAHYDYLQTVQGLEFLNKIGLPKDLLRISVGIEPIEELIAEFKRVEKLI